MKHAILAAAAVCAISTTAFAQDRLTDRDVKALVARIEDARDKFDNALDSDLKTRSSADRTAKSTSRTSSTTSRRTSIGSRSV